MDEELDDLRTPLCGPLHNGVDRRRAIARIESGQVTPSTSALERYAEATRSRLKIIFEPVETGA